MANQISTSNNDVQPCVKILSIGGTGVFGMNCLLIRSPEQKILIDCGVLFPADEDLGVDLITPDFSVLEGDAPDRLLVTHAHEDHVGAIPYLIMALKKAGHSKKLPIYGSNLTIAMIKRRLQEHNLESAVDLNVVSPKHKDKFGDITVEYIDVCHSIPGSLAFALETPFGKIVHSGDWRIDNTPMAGAKTNLGRFESLGDEGVRLFLSDSTNVEVDNQAITSELDVFNDLQKCIKSAQGRVFVTLFASNIGRLQSLIYAASNLGKKLAICGRSMTQNLAIARELDYLAVPPNLDIIPEEKIEEAGDNIVVVVSGSQGERAASLYKISQGLHPKIKLHQGDMLIYSARQIPGNERRVGAIINGFYRQGATIVDAPELHLHSSGHGNQRELELLIELIEPEIFVPIHGDYRRLALHEKLAQRVQTKTITEVLQEGQCLCLYADHHEIHDGFEPSRRYVVGKVADGLDSTIIKQKKIVAHNGVIVINGVIDQNDTLIGNLAVHCYGIAVNNGWLDEFEPELLRTITSSAHHGDMTEIIKHKAAKYIKTEVGKCPEIFVDFHRI